MPASPNDSLQLSERPLEKKLVSELLDIAKAMNIDTAKLHKPDILKAIKVHIQTHPGLADDPHLLPLVGHRTAPKALGKTSAGKATEEEMESSKPKEPRTHRLCAVTPIESIVIAAIWFMMNGVRLPTGAYMVSKSSFLLTNKIQKKLHTSNGSRAGIERTGRVRYTHQSMYIHDLPNSMVDGVRLPPGQEYTYTWNAPVVYGTPTRSIDINSIRIQ
ncbi:hypothetical protein B0H14DRAFT_2652465 [Mycena olivaceomarginata]|nr:hypothetical protein B0H14DRAFT_2652465 [Mycena olivaceomarginata]